MPDAERVPGDKQCRFCRAKASCSALKGYTEAAILSDFDDLDNMPKANTLSDEQMLVALQSKPLIEAWLSAIEAHVKERLATGKGFPGYKLVEGRSLRQWKEENLAQVALVELLGEERAYVAPKLISPAQAEKALGKSRSAEIAELITKSPGLPTLAPESDKRPAINLLPEDFSDCTDQN